MINFLFLVRFVTCQRSHLILRMFELPSYHDTSLKVVRLAWDMYKVDLTDKPHRRCNLVSQETNINRWSVEAAPMDNVHGISQSSWLEF